MSYGRRLAALEAAHTFKRAGRPYDMSTLSDEQLELIERAIVGGSEIDGTTYLNVDEFTELEMAELQKALWLTGVLRKGEAFK